MPDSGADGVRSFSGMDSQIKAVSAVRFTNKQIVLTAAEGYSFMQKYGECPGLCGADHPEQSDLSY